MARPPFRHRHLERTGADRLLDLGEGVGQREPLRQDERGRRGQRREGVEHRERRLQRDAELVVVDRLDRTRGRQQRLAIGVVADTPAFHRGDDIGGAHILPVVPFKPITQFESVGQLVVADRPALDHLRLRMVGAVEREQRVVHHVAVVAGNVDAGPMRIDDRQIGMRHKAQHAARGLRPRRQRRDEERGERKRGKCGQSPSSYHDGDHACFTNMARRKFRSSRRRPGSIWRYVRSLMDGSRPAPGPMTLRPSGLPCTLRRSG